MLLLRVITAAVLIGAIAGALYSSLIVWITFCVVFAVLAAREWFVLVRKDAKSSWYFSGAVGVIASILAIYGQGPWSTLLHGVMIIGWLCIVPASLRHNKLPAQPVVLMGLGAGIIIATTLALVQLRVAGTAVLLYSLGLIWVSDSTAYFSGVMFGRRKLAPLISPGKTWEGIYGAMVGVTLYVLLWREFAPGAIPDFKLFEVGGLFMSMVVALVLMALGVSGDLFESLLKRKAGVKDSGRLLPGHGGVLDRVDALLPVLPLAALLYA